jgi:hypothetical protein
MNLRNCAIADKQHIQRNDAVLHVKTVLSALLHVKDHRVYADIVKRLAHHAPRNRPGRADCFRPKGVIAYF